MKSGDVLASKYRIGQRIGEGAMGDVWAGENLATGRNVALKFIRPSASKQNTLELRKRLLLEARACGKLSHPNIVQIYDVVESADGDPFLVLELLRGRTLGERLKDTLRIRPTMAARIGADVASALADAHDAKIIHRDLKPANIFLHSDDGDVSDRFVVKVLDFGVCKDLGGNTNGPETIPNVAVGSPVYMSPEQVAMRRDLDGRTDIWSLGVVLYEMLTGGRPFVGSVNEVMRQISSTHINRVPAPSTKVRHVSTEFDAIVARCLENDRTRRFADARELAQALTAIADARTPTRPPGSAPRLPSLAGTIAGTELATPEIGPTKEALPDVLVGQGDQGVAVDAALGPTGTQVMSRTHVVASPAPQFLKASEGWRRAKLEAATATRAAAMEALRGGTQAIDAAAMIGAMPEREPTGTTSALGALSQPDFDPKRVEFPVGLATLHRRSLRMPLVVIRVASGLSVVMLLGLAWYAAQDHGDLIPSDAAPSNTAMRMLTKEHTLTETIVNVPRRAKLLPITNKNTQSRPTAGGRSIPTGPKPPSPDCNKKSGGNNKCPPPKKPPNRPHAL